MSKREPYAEAWLILDSGNLWAGTIRLREQDAADAVAYLDHDRPGDGYAPHRAVKYVRADVAAEAERRGMVAMVRHMLAGGVITAQEADLELRAIEAGWVRVDP